MDLNQIKSVDCVLVKFHHEADQRDVIVVVDHCWSKDSGCHRYTFDELLVLLLFPPEWTGGSLDLTGGNIRSKKRL